MSLLFLLDWEIQDEISHEVVPEHEIFFPCAESAEWLKSRTMAPNSRHKKQNLLTGGPPNDSWHLETIAYLPKLSLQGGGSWGELF